MSAGPSYLHSCITCGEFGMAHWHCNVCDEKITTSSSALTRYSGGLFGNAVYFCSQECQSLYDSKWNRFKRGLIELQYKFKEVWELFLDLFRKEPQ